MSVGKLTYSCAALGCENAYFTKITSHEYKNKSFFRFPDKDPERRQRWFKIMKIPKSDKRVYLCEDHFADTFFHSSLKTKLTHYAVPFKNKINIISDILLNSSSFHSSQKENIDTSNSFISDSTDDIKQNNNKRKFASQELQTPKKIKFHSVLSEINESRVKNLSPRKKKLFDINKMQRRRISKLTTSLRKSKFKVKKAYDLSKTKMFSLLENKMDQAGIAFLKSTINNSLLKRPNWTTQDKVLALAIHSRGPKCYNFLRRIIPLPCKSTLQVLLQNIPIQPGLNTLYLKKLSKKIAKMQPLDKTCTLIFDEISLAEKLCFDASQDKVLGYVDLGSMGRQNQIANHALVFMACGLHKKWKQPVSFYFTKDTIKTGQLKNLLKETISALQGIGLSVLATICDQGSTNRSAIKQMCSSATSEYTGPYFYVNNQKIFTLFDPPHLLKSTRNALFKYNIQFGTNKTAKVIHIKKCFDIDKLKRFQGLRRIRQSYFDIDKKSQLKMKVCVAARIFSNTMAAAMESMVSSNLTSKLPSEAMQTAEFIHDMDSLFDSFNGRTPKPEKGKPYRRCMSQKSPHRHLWHSLLSKIENWRFLSKNGMVSKVQMPFKTGWITTIKAAIGLFDECQKRGFRFLRTRALNQDPLENYFANIRSLNAGNTNPNCYQFISTFKTSILNNLIDTHTQSRNCEQDDSSLLDNLQSFLLIECDTEEENIPISLYDDMEFKNVTIPADFNKEKDDDYDKQVTSYVSGFLIKKQKTLNCTMCSENLTTDILAPSHMYTSFKENSDNKQRLIYTHENLGDILKYIHDIVTYLMPNYGHVLHISKKICIYLQEKVSFDWFTCQEHRGTVKKGFIREGTNLVIKKFCDDLYRLKQERLNRSKYVIKKRNIILHK